MRSHRPFRARLRIAPGCFQSQQKTDFPLWVCGQIGLVFSSGFIEGTLSVFNPWLGRWDAPEDAAGSILPQPIPLGHKVRESKGVLPLVPGVKTSSKSRTRRSLAYLSQHLCCYFPLREKVGRGAEHGKAMLSRSARSGGCRGSTPFAPGQGKNQKSQKKTPERPSPFGDEKTILPSG